MSLMKVKKEVKKETVDILCCFRHKTPVPVIPTFAKSKKGATLLGKYHCPKCFTENNFEIITVPLMR